MNRKTLHLVAVLAGIFACSLSLQAQEFPIYNQYHFNYYLANPAVAGVNDCSYFMLTHKQQWTGIKDAPYTTSLSFQTRLPSNFGIGAYIYNDKNGYSTQQAVQLTAAYHIDLTSGHKYTRSIYRDRQLSFALSAKLFNYGFDGDIYDFYRSQQKGNPDYAMEDLGSLLAFNANVGVYYTSYGFFTGLTATNLARVKMPAYSTSMEPIIPLTFMFLIGNEFKLNEEETLEPSLMYRIDERGFMGGDLNLRYARKMPKNEFSWWAQLTFRQNFDRAYDYQTLNLLPMLGFQIKKFHIAYSYGVDLGNLVRYNYGTHELMLGYTLCYTERFCR